MLPDFPTIKRKIQKSFEESIKKEIQKDPLLSQIKIRRVYEGNILTYSSIDGYSDSEKYKLISTKFEIKKEDIVEKGPLAFFLK